MTKSRSRKTYAAKMFSSRQVMCRDARSSCERAPALASPGKFGRSTAPARSGDFSALIFAAAAAVLALVPMVRAAVHH
jgi:hypothetical protein